MVKLKQPEEMHCGLAVGHDICETQSEIFMLAMSMDFDDDDFVEKYMNSGFCNREMDSVHSVYQTSWPEDGMNYLLQETSIKKNKRHYDPDAIEWIGWMYRYLHLRFEMPSRAIYGILPLKDMLGYYEGMHTQDEEYFIDVIYERLRR